MVDVFMNDVFYGVVDNAEDFCNALRKKRRAGVIHGDTSIYYNKVLDAVYIDNTPGRVTRPLIIVNNGEVLVTSQHLKKLQEGELQFEELFNEGLIEYIDAAEEENAYVAMKREEVTKEHTHMEISPLLMFSVVTSQIPHVEFNEGSRLIRGVRIKQGVGFYTKNFMNMMQTDRNTLVYPQKPILKTMTNDFFGINEHGIGQNVVIAIMCYGGYNMDDGVILNQSSIERGLFRTYYYKLYETSEVKYAGGLSDKIAIPSKDVRGYVSEELYKHLEDDGICSVGIRVEARDILIGKMSPPRFLEEVEGFGQMFNVNVESSVNMKENEEGWISKVYVFENNKGDKSVSVLVRDFRMPIVGDKFTSRHGQKGVVGATFKQTDMPFTASGLVPDLIFSPHSIPSRKTVSHVMEVLAGKIAALTGEYVDGTSFEGENLQELRGQLEELGFSRDGTEVMYDPKTGRQMKAEIYIGVSHYLRLKHMVLNKIQARSTGPVQLLTRQPTEGRNRAGGLRMGYMEQFVMIGHGASVLLRERFSSDHTEALVCKGCGYITDPYYEQYKGKCQVCGSTRFDRVSIAYAFKLFINQLRSMGMKIDFEVEEILSKESLEAKTE